MKHLITVLFLITLLLSGCTKKNLKSFDGVWIEDMNFSKSFLTGTLGGKELTASQKLERELFDLGDAITWEIDGGKVYTIDVESEERERIDNGIIQKGEGFIEFLLRFPRKNQIPEYGHMVFRMELRSGDLYIYDDPFTSARRKFKRRSEPVAGGDRPR